LLLRAAESTTPVDQKQFERESEALRGRLLTAQARQREAAFAVVLVVAGDDLAGRDEVVHRLYEWLDPRYLTVHSLWQPTDEERARPVQWRYWRCLPARGEFGVFLGGWTSDTLGETLLGQIEPPELQRRTVRANQFERLLVDDGVLLLKLWLHLPAEELARRAREAQRSGDALGPPDPRLAALAEDLAREPSRTEALLTATSTCDAPWQVIPSVDPHQRDLQAAELLATALERHLDGLRPRAAPEEREEPRDPQTLLDELDLSVSASKDDYRRELPALQDRLRALTRRALAQGRTAVVVFEGWDAAGKGGAIRRVARGVDVRATALFPIGAPTPEELSYPYLWRFWRRLARSGRLHLFDRSWYGRVLVERVEELATPEQWQRAYGEIRDFEGQLVEHGCLVHKFWLQVSEDEQLRRFEQRSTDEFKRYKLTDDDWRNRRRRSSYEQAAGEMFLRTHWDGGPWTLVAGDDKRHARLSVLRTLVERYEQWLG
jgi:polyphosphate:AMP phosphotransferase